MKRYRRAIDIGLIVLGIAIVFLLIQAPPVSTPELPLDKEHQPYLQIARQQGKKAAEKFCINCHDMTNIAGHPTENRCLFCHRLPKKNLKQPLQELLR